MLCRFVSAAGVAAVLVALAILVIGLSPVLSFTGIYPLPVVWCLVPLIWGVWAAIIPKTWVSRRLPLWGAVLGFLAGATALFVLNLSSLVWKMEMPFGLRLLGLVTITLLYYYLWVLVELVHQALEHQTHIPTVKPV